MITRMKRFNWTADTRRAVIRLLWFPAALFWLECVVRLACYGSLVENNLLYPALFALFWGLLDGFLCCIWNQRGNRRASMWLLGLETAWCMVQTVYYDVAATVFTLYSVTGAVGVLQFWPSVVKGIWQTLPWLILEAIPFVLQFKFGRRFVPERRCSLKKLLGLGGAAVAAKVLCVVVILLSRGGVMSPAYLYFESFIPTLTAQRFGIFATLELDVEQLLFGMGGEELPTEEDESPSPPPEPSPTESGTQPTDQPAGGAGETVQQAGWNVMEIDFQTLIEGESDPVLQDMHTYFSQRPATEKNEYTGLFQGKNLIWIVAEGFTTYAMTEETTPTLWKLAHSGFVFENYYNPLWGVSTSDGEYTILTSLIPKSGVWSMSESAQNYLPFTMGNQLRSLGYVTRAFHDHDYTYYNRDQSHPNLGYYFKGVGNGLELYSDAWPESDVEMMESTLTDDRLQSPFHTYYLTVSGHMNYSFQENSMSAKHEHEVGHEDMSEEARAYLACQMELDQAVEYLLERLEETGQLENTVICLSGDHYPYGLAQETIDELAGHEVEQDFEQYRSTWILWSADLEEPVTVTKPCYSLDILPTLSNLFGLEYDSRLLMGHDVFSDQPGLVVFANHSYLTELGRYDASADVFTPNEGAEIGDDYAADTLTMVNDMFTYSALVLEQDYYHTLGLEKYLNDAK